VKVEITKAQLQAIIDMSEEEKAMLGMGEDDSRHIKRLRLISRFLKKNGYEEIYK